jgi:hypothetical protein
MRCICYSKLRLEYSETRNMFSRICYLFRSIMFIIEKCLQCCMLKGSKGARRKRL